MCSGIQCFASHFLQPAATAICTQAQNVIERVEEGCSWLGKKIDDWTYAVLPRAAAVVAAAMIKGIPFVVTRVLLPPPLFLAEIASIFVYKAITTPKGQPIQTRSLANGLAFGGLWNGYHQIVAGLLAENGLSRILCGISQIVASSFMFAGTGLFQQVLGIPETQPQEKTEPSDSPPAAAAEQGGAQGNDAAHVINTAPQTTILPAQPSITSDLAVHATPALPLPSNAPSRGEKPSIPTTK